jgi:hypothetical protein
MPRSLTRPQIGQTVWYFAAAPPAAVPLVGIVVGAVATAGTGVGSPPPTFDLAVYDPAAAAGAGATSKVLAVPFHYGTRPTSGAWCTMMRVNTPAAGVWPTGNIEAMDYELHGLTAEQQQALAQARLAEQQPAA